MALIAYHTAGSYVSFPSRSKICLKEVKCERLLSLESVRGVDKSNLLSRRSFSRAPTIFSAKVKRLKVLAFKGSAQHDESGGRSKCSKISKNSVKLSFVSHDEDTVAKSPETRNGQLSYSSEEENISGSPAIHKLFKKWLMILRTQSSNQVSNGIFGDGPVESGVPENRNVTQNQENDKVLKSAWCYLLGLDPAIKIPLLIFVPCYLAVNLVYGAEVSKELTPLWVFGPVIVALYVKLIQGLIALYIFSFRQTKRIVKSLPTYYRQASNVMADGKIREQLNSRFWQPVIGMKTLDYKKLLTRALKMLREWCTERYLDFVESIWPYYCRTIRFLKQANFI